MLATLSPSIVEGPEWVFEEKYDGIRAVTGRERGKVKIWSRTFQDLTGGFPHVVAAVEALGEGDLLIDGELVALDAKGVSRFQLLQRRGLAGALPTRYAIFDLLQQQLNTAVVELDNVLEDEEHHANLVGERRVRLRELVEQAAAYSGAADEELISRRIAEQEAELNCLTRQCDELS